MRVRAAIVLGTIAWSSVAQAEPTDRKVCLAAVDEGQTLRDEGKLKEAREKFLLCASAGCPSVIVKQCDEWVAAVERDTPTVLFRLHEASGKEVIDVRVIIDGKLVSNTISGQPLALEARDHTFRFELADGRSIEERLVIRVGEKNRMIESTFPAPSTPEAVPPPIIAPPPPPEPPPGFRVPLLGWVGGGVFVVGATTTAVFAIRANGTANDLRESCAPRCMEHDRDAVQRRLVIANVGLFVGLAGLGLGVVATILANRHPRAEKRTYGVRVTPVGIAGTF